MTRITTFEVISLDGWNVVTLEINGHRYDMPIVLARLLASDLTSAIRRAEAK